MIKVDKNKSIEMIRTLSNANGVAGFEDVAVLEIRKYLDKDMQVTEDRMRNLYVNRTENRKKPVVMLDAHSDEVGFMVQSINPNGTLNFVTIGGWVASSVAASKVRVLNADGEYVAGIVASKPPHFMSEADRAKGPDISSMVIDVGARSLDEVVNDFKIRVAAPVVPDAEFSYNEEKDLMLGKAFDCRLGCAAMIDTFEALKGENLDVHLTGVFSVQEEVGIRGAQVAVQTVEPDIAILFEGCPADDTTLPAHLVQTGMKKGPMLRHIDMSMITNPRWQRYALDLAKKHDIPVQEAVRTGGGTNGRAIHLNKHGVPTIVIGLPVRYIHAHYGFAAYEDYQNAVKLAVEIIKTLNEEIIYSF